MTRLWFTTFGCPTADPRIGCDWSPPLTAPDGPNRLLGPGGGLAEARPPGPGRDALRVSAVRAFVTAPEGTPLVVVRVDTSEPGLYGLGCATFTQRYAAVAAAGDEHVGPLGGGRHPADNQGNTPLIQFSPYWRNGPVLNNALSGVDQALWDIAGKRAGLPLYELLGGRSRSAVEVYSHAAGATRGGSPRSPNPDGWDVHRYLADTPRLFAAARERLGDRISLMHDVHSRLT